MKKIILLIGIMLISLFSFNAYSEEVWTNSGETVVVGQIVEPIYNISDTIVVRQVSESGLNATIARETASIARLQAKIDERQAKIDQAKADKIELRKQ